MSINKFLPEGWVCKATAEPTIKSFLIGDDLVAHLIHNGAVLYWFVDLDDSTKQRIQNRLTQGYDDLKAHLSIEREEYQNGVRNRIQEALEKLENA